MDARHLDAGLLTSLWGVDFTHGIDKAGGGRSWRVMGCGRSRALAQVRIIQGAVLSSAAPFPASMFAGLLGTSTSIGGRGATTVQGPL